MDIGHYGWTRNLNYYQTHAEFVIAPVPQTSKYGLFNLGDGRFDGTSGGYSGNVNGTGYALNFSLSTTSDLANWQVNAVSKFMVDSSGNTTIAGVLNLSAQPDIQALVWMEAM